jgi:hypothetical protein
MAAVQDLIYSQDLYPESFSYDLIGNAHRETDDPPWLRPTVAATRGGWPCDGGSGMCPLSARVSSYVAWDWVSIHLTVPQWPGELGGLTFEGGGGVQLAGDSDSAHSLPGSGVQHLQKFFDLHRHYASMVTPPEPHRSLQFTRDSAETQVWFCARV